MLYYKKPPRWFNTCEKRPEKMQKILQRYHKSITPPYSRKTTIIILAILLIIIAIPINIALISSHILAGNHQSTSTLAAKSTPVTRVATPTLLPSPTATAQSDLNLVQYVNPFIGTDNGVSD